MKYVLLPFIALGIGTAAYAADYPPCSKTVQDECTSAPAARHGMKAHRIMHEHHAAMHHSAKGKTEKTAKS